MIRPGLCASLRVGGAGSPEKMLFDLYAMSDTVVMAGIEGKWDGSGYAVEFTPSALLRPGMYRLAPRGGRADSELLLVPGSAASPGEPCPGRGAGPKDYKDRFLRNVTW